MSSQLSLIPVLLVVSLLFCKGCALYQEELGTALSESAAPDPDRDLELADVLAQLGPPHRLSQTPGGFVLAYEHWTVKEKKLGLSLRPIGIEFINIDWGTSSTQGEFLLLFFDRGHRLQSSTWREWSTDVGGGKSLTPIGSVVAVVDVGDLTKAMPQHRWGMNSLRPLPVTLNSASNMENGASGIEQRGTPSGAGQHSLEFR